MFAKRILLPMFLILITAVAASAQSGERGSLWKKLSQHKAKTNAIQSLAEPEQEITPQGNVSAAAAKGRLEGTWLATVTFPDGFEIQVLFTFMAGKDENEGTLIDTNNFLLTPNPIGAPDQGVWQRTAQRSFIATHLAFLFDTENGGEPAGTAKVRDTIVINDLGTQFTGRQYIEIFDPNGQLVDTFQATMRATRIVAQAPPNQ